MKSNHRLRSIYSLVAAMTAGWLSQALANDVPAQLPDPDGEPGDATKPVKVYILAGQSNMVGMGDVGGAKNLYNGIYLTPDPAAPYSRRAPARADFVQADEGECGPRLGERDEHGAVGAIWRAWSRSGR